jgi:hypothetical protein
MPLGEFFFDLLGAVLMVMDLRQLNRKYSGGLPAIKINFFFKLEKIYFLRIIN